METTDTMLARMTSGAIKNVPETINKHHLFNGGKLTAANRVDAYNLLICYGGLGGGAAQIQELAAAMSEMAAVMLYEIDSLSSRILRLHAVAFQALDRAFEHLIESRRITVTETDHLMVVVTSEYREAPRALEGFEDAWGPWIQTGEQSVERRCPRGGQTARYMMSE
jgi:hypothetical protein